MESGLLKSFPCAECAANVAPDQAREQVALEPVDTGQFGYCTNCGASHMIVSASTKGDYIALEPILLEMRRSLELTSF
ncbi:hypothetical protein [Pseudomonas fluorescens]|uniref:hypothetical protein n=1 Tax=Pseudomonas fluorescens TaxID=294 RepID=UPI001240C2D7|nr:hypothetical protein [Pseudomonas fluorescens]